MTRDTPIDLTTDTGTAEDVAFFIFNRPDLTRKVVAEIARYQPARLLVVADGPRHPEETAVCEETRKAIRDADLKCEILCNYSETNLGCKKRVSTGLQWVFEQCERAIILEDDCLPDPSFFRFCSALLEYYEDDPRVMHVGGSTFCEPQADDGATYYFSRHTDIWGWATWRRAFAHYDPEMADWPVLRENLQNGAFGAERDEINFWTAMFDQTKSRGLDTWDFQWHFAVFKNRGLACVPKVNLVSNLGWGKDATHTDREDSAVSRLPTSTLEEVRHPPSMSPDERNCAAFFHNRYYDGFFSEEMAGEAEDDRRMEEGRKRALAHASTGARPTSGSIGLSLGAVPPEAFDGRRTEKSGPAGFLRKLSRIKLLQSANLSLLRAALIGDSAISEMKESQVADHFVMPLLLGGVEAPVVFDVGCHEGQFAGKIREDWPSSRVHAFDPNLETTAGLEAAGVVFHPLALGALPGPATLYYKRDAPGGPEASLSREVVLLASPGPAGEKTVECATIDSVLSADDDLEKVDLLKISVGGLEWEVLLGADDALRGGNLPALIFKFGPEQALTATPMVYFFDRLKAYRLYRMTPNKLARMENYDFITSEVFADQQILAIAPCHPQAEAIREVSRR